ncbi:MAG: hypothetical protein ACF8XB_13645 [Planctomycetota bacterium JB042]
MTEPSADATRARSGSTARATSRPDPPRRQLATEGHVRGIAIGSAACFAVAGAHVARAEIPSLDRGALLAHLGVGVVSCGLLYRFRSLGRLMYVSTGAFLAVVGFTAGVLMTVSVLVALFDRKGMLVLSPRYASAIAARPELRPHLASSPYLWGFLFFAGLGFASLFLAPSSIVVR